MRFSTFSARGLVTAAFMAATSTWLAAAVPSPKEHFGAEIGTDYTLVDYTSTESYFEKIAAASDRAKLIDIGLTTEGRKQPMLIVSSPANLAKLDHYRDIGKRLARAEGLTDDEARALSLEGKAIVWVDGGLHSTEMVATHQLIEAAWQFTSRTDPETLRILDHVIILFVHCNPDGHELTTKWYMRESDPKKRYANGNDFQLPVLYQKYAGHDNNRDFFMMNLEETRNISRAQYIDWIPQIILNHHQTGPAGVIISGPPFRDPANPHLDPLLLTSLDSVGGAFNNRFNVEGKPGVGQRNAQSYSTWWNGGLRTTPYFHNIIGILTEIKGSPTPQQLPLIADKILPSSNLPNPAGPITFHFRQAIDYMMTSNYAVLDYAARHSDQLLYNIYRMGKNSIERGSHDHWTTLPSRVDALKALAVAKKGSSAGSLPIEYFAEALRKPEDRDPRGFIIPSDQADFPTAVKFINTLILSGVKVERATAAFSVGDKNYPAGSYVVKTNQAFRPHVLDLFEPQDHPNDFAYEGGPPVPPYDSAGWTLAFQMGVKFDRVLDGFEGPFATIAYGELQTAPAMPFAPSAGGWVLAPNVNDHFIVVNRLLAAGAPVFRLPAGLSGQDGFGPGSFFVPPSPAAHTVLTKAAAELGVNAQGLASEPAGEKLALKSFRIGLWDEFGGSMPSGWVRFIFDKFEYGSYEVIYPQQIMAGDLISKFDAIVFVSEAFHEPGKRYRSSQPKPENVPDAERVKLGNLERAAAAKPLKEFMEAGGIVVTIGSSTGLAYELNLPIRDALVMNDGKGIKPLSHDQFYIPGSIMHATVAQNSPTTWGMPADTDFYFDESPVFALTAEAFNSGIRPLAWYTKENALRSGWAWGADYLKDGVAAFEAPVGQGKFVAFGPEVTFRSQTHGTFKLLFNTLYGTQKPQ
jgi:hypothetical protein